MRHNNTQFEEFYYRSLFNNFVDDYPAAQLLNGTIKFSMVYSWFSYKKLSKRYARLVIKEWVNRGLVERVRFHGIRLKSNHMNNGKENKDLNH